MRIDGRLIASEIKSELAEKISILKHKNIIPQLAVVLVGNDPSSQTYVRQKQKVAEELGIKVSLKTPQGWQACLHGQAESLQDTPGVASIQGLSRCAETKKAFACGGIRKKLIKLVDKLNHDKSVHGIIIQRPLPISISKEELDLLVIPDKDVDGFHPDSPFTPPIALAVLKILEYVFVTAKSQMHAIASICYQKAHQGWHRPMAELTPPMVEELNKDYFNWLKKQSILVIGRGETAGKPIAETLQKIGVNLTIAHSKTNNLQKLCLTSDIIITCAGRPDIVRRDMLNKNLVLIGVGLHQENGKLLTDYDQDEIADKVAYYTPVPGGVGPVNVACLFENLLLAT